jgi:hypothetical protein
MRTGKKEVARAAQAAVAVPQQQRPKTTEDVVKLPNEPPKPPEPQQLQPQAQIPQQQPVQPQAPQPPVEVKAEVKPKPRNEEFGPLRPMRDMRATARAGEGEVEWASVLLAQRDVDVTVPPEIVLRGVQDVPGLFTPKESLHWAHMMYRAWRSGKNVKEVLAKAYEEALKKKATKEKT